MVVFCTECGTKMEIADAKFCRECGQPVKKPAGATSTTPRSTTSLASPTNNVKRSSASSLPAFVKKDSVSEPVARTSLSTPTQGACETCGCTNFKPDAFRNTKCANCFHIHNQKPTLAASTPTSTPSSPVLTHALAPKPKAPASTTDKKKDESRPYSKSATAPASVSVTVSSSSAPSSSSTASSSAPSKGGKVSRRCSVLGCSRWVFENGKCKQHCSDNAGGAGGAKTKKKFSDMMDQMKKSAAEGTSKLGELFKREEKDGKDDDSPAESRTPGGHVKYENMVDAEDVIPFLNLGFRKVLCAEGSDNPLPAGPIDDYRAKHLHALDLNDKEFNFLDYAPGFFHSFRQLFGITSQVYIRSLVLDGINGGKLGAGKSGMLFFYSNDKRFVVKTLTREEVAFFRHILPHYDKFVRGSLHTLIPRFFGMYKITMPDKKLRVIVMNNLFDCPGLKLSEKYDLKGSTRNRYVDIEKEPELAKGVLKDMNFTEKKIHLGPQRDAVMTQLRIDTEFLMEMNIMDQSLLLGIHQEADTSNEAARYTLLPATPPAKLTKMKGRDDRPDLYNVFQIQGGVRGWDAATNRPSNVVYVFGVIDILQMFNAHKRLESAYKSARYGKAEISAIDSRSYGQRFLEYMEAHIA